jgi:biopolymer transport protein ExbD
MKKLNTDEKVTFDMTPMIDCTFQLVIFFMLTLNYSQEDQDSRIRLPSSELAKPAQTATDTNIVLQMTDRNSVLIGGDEVPVTALKPLLTRERTAINANPKRSIADVSVVIRADRDSLTGKVQDIIQISQQVGFEKFVLRAKEEGS